MELADNGRATVRESPDAEDWLYVSMSRDRFVHVRSGDIDLRSAFAALLRAGLVKLDSADSVHFESALLGRAEDAAFLLPPDTRAAVLRAAGHWASASQRSVPAAAASRHATRPTKTTR